MSEMLWVHAHAPMPARRVVGAPGPADRVHDHLCGHGGVICVLRGGFLVCEDGLGFPQCICIELEDMVRDSCQSKACEGRRGRQACVRLR